MQKIILFVEPNDVAFSTPSKIGDILMNRLAIDEMVSCEILKRFELAKTSFDMSWPNGENCQKFFEERKQKGMDYFIVIVYNQK